MKKQCLKIISISLLTLTLVACGPKPKDKGTASTTTTTSSSKKIDNSSSTLASSEADSTSTSKGNDPIPSSSSNVQVTPPPASSGENHDLLKNQDEAQAFLQSVLTEYNNEDTVYIEFANGENNKGVYYDFKLVSKEIQKNGGSGTLAIYRVYQNKTYELYPEN